jgi:HD superfamily phosphohydrolase YqeK
MEADTPGLRPTLPEWAIVTPARREHIERVAELAGSWALEMGVPESERHRWLRAVWLHDALRDAPEDELQRWAPDAPGPVELRHGPASAARAKAEGETDRGVLDAVRYHSLGLAEWDMVGRILYCADYLEPGRKFAREWRAELAERLPSQPSLVIRQVARARVGHLVSSGRPLLEPTVRFWNSLVVDFSGSD